MKFASKILELKFKGHKPEQVKKFSFGRNTLDDNKQKKKNFFKLKWNYQISEILQNSTSMIQSSEGLSIRNVSYQCKVVLLVVLHVHNQIAYKIFTYSYT